MVLVLLAGAVAGGAYWHLHRWARTPVAVDGEAIVAFPTGTPLLNLAQALEDQSVVTNAAMFYVWVRFFEPFQSFQAGKYRFMGQVSPRDVVRTIVKGETYNPIVLSVTIPEGFALRQVVERLAANKVGHIVELKRLTTDKAFLESLSVPAKTLEGFVFPATYNFVEMPTAMKVFETMVKTFWQNLPKDYEKRVNAKGLTLAEAVTFASLIEVETRNDDERPLISEVIWRRLKDNAPIAIDAALIYGIPDYDGDLKWAHLSDAKNPYNTRIHKGLPPTPVGAPSTKSLEAVLIPSNFGYYYYVAMPGSTRHHFSKTLKEHNEHVKKLVKATKRDK